jgi:addiction module RelE/StbE family toxin
MNNFELALSSYALGGAIVGLVLYLKGRGTFTTTDRWVHATLMLLWPISLLIALGITLFEVFNRYRKSRDAKRFDGLLRRSLQTVKAAHPELQLTEQQAIANLMTDLAQAGGEGKKSHIDKYWLGFGRDNLDEIKRTLGNIWEPPEPTHEDVDIATSIAPNRRFSIQGNSLGGDEWGFHMTKDFRKCVKDLDKNLRGRVLDAIAEICIKPMELRGDTVKPLTGELNGFWRYRLGDYRLIYHPDAKAHRIDLVTIGGRGDVYAH